MPITKTDFFELNFLHSDQEIWQKGCHSDFSTVWSHLPCCLSKGLLKRDFFDIYPTRFFAIRNFGNTLAMTIIFFLKVFKSSSTFKIAEKNREKFFCFLDNCIWIDCVNLSQKRDFLHIYVTTVFRVRNFENTSAMRVLFLLEIFKILSTFQKCRKKF